MLELRWGSASFPPGRFYRVRSESFAQLKLMGVLPITLVEPGFLPRCSRETNGTFFPVLFLFFFFPPDLVHMPVHLSHLITIFKIKCRLGVCRYFPRGLYVPSRAPGTCSLLQNGSLAEPEGSKGFRPDIACFSLWRQAPMCSPGTLRNV